MAAVSKTYSGNEMSYSLNSLKGCYIRHYMGDYERGILVGV